MLRVLPQLRFIHEIGFADVATRMAFHVKSELLLGDEEGAADFAGGGEFVHEDGVLGVAMDGWESLGTQRACMR